MSYKTLVAQGKKMLREEQYGEKAWAWGDLAIEAVPVGKHGTNSGALDRLRRFADDIGWIETRSVGTLRRYRQVAAAWPAETRITTVSYNAHAVLSGHPDRFELIKTPKLSYKAARELAGKPVLEAERRAYRVAPERIVASLHDREFVRLVLADPEVRRLVSSVLSEDDQRVAPRRNLFARLVAA